MRSSKKKQTSNFATGTSVTITLEGKYQKGRQSVDEYISQTAMSNPHATIIYNAPNGDCCKYKRQSKEQPFIPKEVKPHPYGVELGVLYRMARDSKAKRLSMFLANEFINTIKYSAIVSVVSIQELTFQAMQLMAATYVTIEVWLTVTVLYLVMCLSLSFGVQWLERRLARSEA